MLSLDKTNLSQGTGNAQAHPLLITTSNIVARCRNSLPAHALMLAALIPDPKFLHHNRKVCHILEQRVLHKTYDLVTKRLKIAAKSGHDMSNALGNVYKCYTPLTAVMVDLLEAWPIAAVMQSVSITSTASAKEFGDPDAHLPRRGAQTLAKIKKIIDSGVDPDNIPAFATACEKQKLSGVAYPFWRNWPYSAEPYHFLCPDALHGIHRFFFDHDLNWGIAAISAEELDFRYLLQQPRVGRSHFKNGVSKLKQVTGHEHRELQKTFIAVIDGLADDRFIRATRALAEFRYLAQAEVISEQDIAKLKGYLSEFHQHKSAVEPFRTSKKWQIPKLERLHYLIASISDSGAPYQYSTDRTESAHIELVKEPYRHSNRKNYFSQICRILSRREKHRRFTTHLTFHLARLRKYKMLTIASPTKKLPPAHPQPPVTPVRAVTLEDILAEDLLAPKRPITDYFLDSKKADSIRSINLMTSGKIKQDPPNSFCTPCTAFHFTYKPNLRNMSINEVARRFRIPDLHSAICDYFFDHTIGPGKRLREDRVPSEVDPTFCLPFASMDVWYSVRVQNYDVNNRLLQGLLVQATERLPSLPRGRFDTCLVINDRNFMKAWDGKLDVTSGNGSC